MKTGHRGPKICILATQKKLKKTTDNLVVMLSQKHKPREDGKSDFFYITGADTEMALLDKHRNYRSRAEKE